MRTAHLHLGPNPLSEAQDVMPTCPAATQVTMLLEQVDSSLILSQHSCMCKCVCSGHRALPATCLDAARWLSCEKFDTALPMRYSS